MLKDFIESGYMPWFFGDGKVKKDDGVIQWTHAFYKDGISSFWIDIIKPIIEKLNVNQVLRIKANLNLKCNIPIESDFHTDIDVNKDDKDETKICIYYVNTNNGKTDFEIGKTVNSVENRAVLFSNKLKHRGILQTDIDNRIVINIIYR